MAYGFGVFEKEEKELQNVIEDFLYISKEEDNKKDNVQKSYDLIKNLDCPDIRLIDSFVSERETLFKLYGNRSTEKDFVHIGPQATKNKIFGTMWESAQFQFYAEKFQNCTQGLNDGKECQDSFQSMSLIDACTMTEYSEDLGKGLIACVSPISIAYRKSCL